MNHTPSSHSDIYNSGAACLSAVVFSRLLSTFTALEMHMKKQFWIKKINICVADLMKPVVQQVTKPAQKKNQGST